MNESIRAFQSGAAAGHAEQRVSTQSKRLQWDADWIAEQRLAGGVICTEECDQSTAYPHYSIHSAAGDVPAKHVDPLQHSPLHTMSLHAPKPSEALVRPGPPQQFAARVASLPDTAPSLTHPQTQRCELPSAEGQISMAGRTRARTTLSHFGMWRDDDAVRISMRVRDSASATGIVAVLRGWLREAGLKLVQLTVNGRIEGNRAEAAQRSMQGTHSRFNARI